MYGSAHGRGPYVVTSCLKGWAQYPELSLIYSNIYKQCITHWLRNYSTMFKMSNLKKKTGSIFNTEISSEAIDHDGPKSYLSGMASIISIHV